MVFDPKTQLTEEYCTENYQRIAKSLDCRNLSVSDRTRQATKSLPTTHTLGVAATDSVFLTGDAAGLLCVAERNPIELATDYDKWKEAMEVGLEFYVFSYHGIHDPWYAKSPYDEPDIPIGVFLKRTTEHKGAPEVNATFRDLAVNRYNPDLISRPFEQWFLSPDDARSLCGCEVAKNYSDDFWNYWGNPYSKPFLNRATKGTNWQHYYEFHFRDRVQPEHFGAVLWPVEARREKEAYILFPCDPYELVVARWPHLRFLKYLWPPNEDRRAESFFRASFEAAQYYVAHGDFPEYLSLKMEYLTEG